MCFPTWESYSIPKELPAKYICLPAMKIWIELVMPAASSPKVAKVKWWMQHYQGPTPKRHYGYSNSREVLTLDKGKLKKHQRKPKDQRIRTADVYKDGNGVKRYKGNANLRPTQILVCIRNVFGWRNPWLCGHLENDIWYIDHLVCDVGTNPSIVNSFPQASRPRIYPMPFARHLIDRLESMKASCKGAPTLPTEVPDAKDSFTQWTVVNSEDWQFSAMAEVFQYLRGNRHLVIPQQWRGIIPDRLG